MSNSITKITYKKLTQTHCTVPVKKDFMAGTLHIFFINGSVPRFSAKPGENSNDDNSDNSSEAQILSQYFDSNSRPSPFKKIFFAKLTMKHFCCTAGISLT